MTVRTQQAKIAFVVRPILEASRPNIVSIFGALFGLWVKVVDIQYSEIVNPTSRTLPAQGRNNFEFSRPVALVLIDFVSVFIPVGFEAFCRAVSNIARLATRFTLSILSPPMSEITRLVAILTVSLANAVPMHHVCFPAARTLNSDRFSSHSPMISNYKASCKPKYFEIAVKRISDAQDQFALFDPVPPPVKQAELFGGGE